MSHVLIVDDDANTREALAALVTQEGFTTAVAGSVAEARVQLVRQRPDVVLMDLRLPEGELRAEIGALRELRNDIHRVFIMAGDEGLEGPAPETEQTLMRNPTSTSQQPSNTPAITVPLGTPLSVAARELILSTLEHCGGERKRTAEMLGICTKTLYNRLREYGIRGEEARSSSNAAPMGDQSQAA